MPSPAPLTAFPHTESNLRVDQQAARAAAAKMLGGEAQLKFAHCVLDTVSGRRVAGSFVNNLIMVSLGAGDIKEVADNLCFQFAHKDLLNDAERALVRRAFAPGTELNFRTVHALAQRRMPAEMRQAQSDSMLAAAHAYAMWKQGHMSVEQEPVTSLFGKIADVLQDGMNWLRRTVLMERVTTVPQLFEALASGELARSVQQARVTSAAARPSALKRDMLDDEPIDEVAVVRPRMSV